MTSLVGYIDLTVEGDATDETDETVVLRLSNPVNVVFPGGAATLDATGTITDDDAMPALSIQRPVGGRRTLRNGNADIRGHPVFGERRKQIRVAWGRRR